MRKYFNDNPESFMQNWDNYPVFNQNPCTLVILVSLGIVVSCPCWFLEHPPQAYQVYSILLNPRTFQASLLIPLQLYCTEELHTCLLFVYITSSTGNFNFSSLTISYKTSINPRPLFFETCQHSIWTTSFETFVSFRQTIAVKVKASIDLWRSRLKLLSRASSSD